MPTIFIGANAEYENLQQAVKEIAQKKGLSAEEIEKRHFYTLDAEAFLETYPDLSKIEKFMIPLFSNTRPELRTGPERPSTMSALLMSDVSDNRLPEASTAQPFADGSRAELRSDAESKDRPWLDDLAYLNRQPVQFDDSRMRYLIENVEEWANIRPKEIQGTIVIPGFSGNSGHLILAAESFPQAQIIGVEWDADAVKNVREDLEKIDADLSSRIQVYVADARNLREVLADESVELVLFVAVLDTYEFEHDGGNLARILIETVRVLKPNGIVAAGWSGGYPLSEDILTELGLIDVNASGLPNALAFKKPVSEGEGLEARTELRNTRFGPQTHSLEDVYELLEKALRKGKGARFFKVAHELEERATAWAVVGDSKAVRKWRGKAKKPRIYSHKENKKVRELFASNIVFNSKILSKRFGRVIDAAMLTIPEDQVGVLYLRKISDLGRFKFEISSSEPTNLQSIMYFTTTGFIEESALGPRAKFFLPEKLNWIQPNNEADSKEQLQGGSYSAIHRITKPDGSTVIEKRANTKRDGGKLRREAEYMQQMHGESIAISKWFPEIYSIGVEGDETVVLMEDIPWGSLTELFEFTFKPSDMDLIGDLSKLNPSKKSLLEVMTDVYKTLTPDLYSKRESPTPPDFLETYHFSKLRTRWDEARKLSEHARKILDAPYVVVDREKYFPKLETMLKIIEHVSGDSPDLFLPPYLSKQHGDLHLGNILADPYHYLLTGDVSQFKLIDPKYMPEGNDPLSFQMEIKQRF